MFHLKCVHLDVSPAEDWVCPECVLVMAAENLDTRWAFSLYLYLYFQLLSVFVLSSCICVCKSCWSGLEQCGCWVWSSCALFSSTRSPGRSWWYHPFWCISCPLNALLIQLIIPPTKLTPFQDEIGGKQRAVPQAGRPCAVPRLQGLHLLPNGPAGGCPCCWIIPRAFSLYLIWWPITTGEEKT